MDDPWPCLRLGVIRLSTIFGFLALVESRRNGEGEIVHVKINAFAYALNPRSSFSSHFLQTCPF